MLCSESTFHAKKASPRIDPYTQREVFEQENTLQNNVNYSMEIKVYYADTFTVIILEAHQSTS